MISLSPPLRSFSVSRSASVSFGSHSNALFKELKALSPAEMDSLSQSLSGAKKEPANKNGRAFAPGELLAYVDRIIVLNKK